ncbi:unnamed protein product [Rhizoctonia solani]|uniref:Uncharacterized protein n=1 Tax=Rhizoctonia solani TaxID=456999 RepID=A0A8H3CS41_9AGAM|nr:unnamed protein product [Rhizoctonia solani]
MSSYTYTPFPFNVTPASPLFELSPIGSDLTQGWVPSCFTPECVPTASWATGSIGATLSFQFWGWDVTFDGNVKGNMSVEILRDGVKEIWNPSADTLFSFHGALTDEFYYHSITLKVLDASPNSELIVNQARVNGSTFGGSLDYDRRTWTIPSSDERLIYSGFSEQASVAQEETLITYVSAKAGGKAFMRFNG